MVRFRLAGFAFIATVALGSVACRPQSAGLLLSDGGESDTVTIAVTAVPPPSVAQLFEVLRSGSKIHDYGLTLASRQMPSTSITEEVEIPYNATGYNPYTGSHSYLKHDAFKGLVFDDLIIAFKKTRVSGDNSVYWVPHSIVPRSVLSGASNAEKMKFYVDAKYYEPQRLQKLSANLDSAEFMLRFVPGYAGAEKVFYTAESKWDVMVGVAQIAGDAAFLGLGSKIQVVRKGAAGVVLIASGTRLADAGKTLHSGKFTAATGVDAFLATLEASLATVTLIKLRIPRAGTTNVKNLDEARALSGQLNRSADDILSNGISRSELESVVGKLSRAADDAAEQASGWVKRFSACLSGAGSGFSLLDSSTQKQAQLCQMLARYADNMKNHGYEYGWIKKSLWDELPKLTGNRDILAKFKNAIKKGPALDKSGQAGIKQLDGQVGRYTHELKIRGSADRLLGYLETVTVKGQERVVAVFDQFKKNGLHGGGN